jgi:hypothetical protein
MNRSLPFSLAILFLFSFLGLDAQIQQDVKSFVFPLVGKSTPREFKKDAFPNIEYLAPLPGGTQAQSYMEKVKSSYPERIFPQEKLYKGTLGAPSSLQNFEGNRYPTGAPNDNDMAISNGGKIVSMVNTTVSVFDTSGTLLKTWSFAKFTDTLKNYSGKYDGRVLYDPIRDRFITAILAGYSDTATYCILSFSKTNDPLGEWNHYKLSGNPLNDTSWSDYPILALTKSKLYLTLNLLANKLSWQLGFKQSVIWRIDLDSAFNGTGLSTQLYYNNKIDGKNIRNICPVQSGIMPETDNIVYFLNNKNFSKGTDSLVLIKLDNLKGGQKTITPLQLNDKYAMAPNAVQKAAVKLQTNDARILDAIKVGQKLYYVGNSLNTTYNSAAVQFGMVDLNNLSQKQNLSILTDAKLDYGYPSLAFVGGDTTKDDILLTLNYTGKSDNAGVGTMYYSKGSFSDLTRMKDGNSFIAVYSSPSRWGDYSGCQRRYNQVGRAWIAGTFGQKVIGSSTNYTYGTWIGEVGMPGWQVGIENTKSTSTNKLKIYPNPLEDYQDINFEFENPINEKLIVYLMDMSGKIITKVIEKNCSTGKFSLHFNTASLSKGGYILQVMNEQNSIVASKEIMIK